MAALGAMGKNVTNPGFVPWGIRIRKNVGYKNVYENSESRPYPTFCPTLVVCIFFLYKHQTFMRLEYTQTCMFLFK